MEKNNEIVAPNRISFDISTEHWQWRQVQSSNSPSPRHLHSLVSHSNNLFLFGGFGDGEKYLNDFWQFSFGNLLQNIQETDIWCLIIFLKYFGAL